MGGMIASMLGPEGANLEVLFTRFLDAAAPAVTSQQIAK